MEQTKTHKVQTVFNSSRGSFGSAGQSEAEMELGGAEPTRGPREKIISTKSINLSDLIAVSSTAASFPPIKFI